LRRQAFADDLIMWILGDFRDGVIHPSLQASLELVEGWSQMWRITFSPKKCECICFRGKSIQVARRFEARFLGEALPHVPALRYLGVWFDEHLSWRRHVQEVGERARTRLWALRRCIGTEWGLHPLLFLRLVRGAILPSLFYASPVWASVLGSGTLLAMLDRILAMGARMAFGLERFTSHEASLALAGLGPARLHIMRGLMRHLVRHHRQELLGGASTVHRSYTTPMELGRAWFRREALSSTLSDPPPVRQDILFRGIDRALRLEWQRRWHNSESGRTLYGRLTTIGEGWLPEDADQCPRPWLVLAARFLTGHCHLGHFEVPRDPDELALCPLCEEYYSTEHLLWECTALVEEREHILSDMLRRHGADTGWLLRVASGRLGRFLWAVRGRLSIEEVS
jgi:hypothetical protein